MTGKWRYLSAIHPQFLSVVFAQNDRNGYRMTGKNKTSTNIKTQLSLFGREIIRLVEVTLCETEIINSIKQVGFPGSVFSAYCGYPLLKKLGRVGGIAKLGLTDM